MKLGGEAYEPLAELVNIGIGQAAGVLNTMLGSHVRLSAPSLRVMSPEELTNLLASRGDVPMSAVEMDFSGELSGSVELVFPSSDAGRLVDCITSDLSESGEDMDSLRAGTLCEVGNIVINAMLGTLANLIKVELRYSMPVYLLGSARDLISDANYQATSILLVSMRFQVESIEVDGELILFFLLDSYESLQRALEEFIHG